PSENAKRINTAFLLFEIAELRRAALLPVGKAGHDAEHGHYHRRGRDLARVVRRRRVDGGLQLRAAVAREGELRRAGQVRQICDVRVRAPAQELHALLVAEGLSALVEARLPLVD